MYWKNVGGVLLGDGEAEVRSLRLPDGAGRARRLRACTVWKTESPRFSATPARARLIKTPDGSIGVFISGRNMGYVKVGAGFLVRSSLLVPFNALSRKAVRRLTRNAPCTLEDMDGMLIGRER